MCYAVFLLLMAASTVSAEYLAGIAIDTSTNMLMRPEGEAGTFASLYGAYSHSLQRLTVSYGIDSGFVEHYEGLQYQRHSFDASLPLVESDRGFLDIMIEGGLARYGKVTVLDGYDEFGITSTAKYYLTPEILLRWGGSLNRRSHRSYDTENYDEAGSFLRFDRFFDSGMTVRAQIDYGFRRYTELTGTPSATLAGIRLRVAKSLGTDWGVWAEGSASGISPIESAADSTELFDRIFLDDPYKYSKVGLVVNVKHVFGSTDTFELRSGIQQRRYDDSLGSAYWYLPETGWDEMEVNFTMSVSYHPAWITELVVPSLDMYYRDVSASDDVLSYNAAGMTLRFECF